MGPPDPTPPSKRWALGLTPSARAVSKRDADLRIVRTVVSADRARRLALALSEAIEQDHHGRPSFRVAGRIFATLWDADHMNVMVDPPGILTAVQSHPDVCEEVWWGKRLAAVRVDLREADERLLAELLADAWERKAPARMRGDAGSP